MILRHLHIGWIHCIPKAHLTWVSTLRLSAEFFYWQYAFLFRIRHWRPPKFSQYRRFSRIEGGVSSFNGRHVQSIVKNHLLVLLFRRFIYWAFARDYSKIVIVMNCMIKFRFWIFDLMICGRRRPRLLFYIENWLISDEKGHFYLWRTKRIILTICTLKFTLWSIVLFDVFVSLFDFIMNLISQLLTCVGHLLTTAIAVFEFDTVV